MGMVRVEEDRMRMLVTDRPDQRRDLADADEVALALGHTDQHRESQRRGRGHYALERHQVGDVEVADGDPASISVGQGLAQIHT
jgi:hypothetical protein